MNDPASNGDAAASTPTTVRCTGGEAVARALAAHGVGPMFGMGGFQLLPFYDAVAELGLQHHLINDERSACVRGRRVRPGDRPRGHRATRRSARAPPTS